MTGPRGGATNQLARLARHSGGASGHTRAGAAATKCRCPAAGAKGASRGAAVAGEVLHAQLHDVVVRVAPQGTALTQPQGLTRGLQACGAGENLKGGGGCWGQESG